MICRNENEMISAECNECIHGFCTEPNVCQCYWGFSGEHCDQCVKHPECHHGHCINKPFQCECWNGYTGLHCNETVCSDGCHPEHVNT